MFMAVRSLYGRFFHLTFPVECSRKSYMAADLIFHLGLTKNASSFLQRKVFHGKMNTLRRAIEWGDDRVEAKNFKDVFRKNHPSYWMNDGAKWFDKYNNDQSLGPVIISHESLYEHTPFGVEGVCLKGEPELLSNRLKCISRYAWSHGKTKAWFFFRRQEDWIPSIYAQLCYRLPKPSQKDFEYRARDFIYSELSGSHVLEYDKLVESLEEALGSNNVLALPFEAIGEEWVWEKVRAFTGEDSLKRNEEFDKRDVNVKRMPGETDWKVSQRANLNLGLASSLNSASKKVGINIPEGAKSKLKGLISKNGFRVGVPDNLAKEIKSIYHESNKRLSEKIGVDLKKYGY